MSKKKIIARARDNARVAAACMTGGKCDIHQKNGITTLAVGSSGSPGVSMAVLDKQAHGRIAMRKIARALTREYGL